MSEPIRPSDIPDIHAIGTESGHTANAQPLDERVRGLENALTNGFLSQFEQDWADRRHLAETAGKALGGDKTAQQALADMLAHYAQETGQRLRDLTQQETWQALTEEKKQEIQAIRQAYLQADYEDAAKLTGIAIAGMVDLKRKGSHHDAHRGEPIEWESTTHAHAIQDADKTFSLSPNETLQIGNRTFTHEDEVEHILIRAPLRDADLVPIDDHDPLAPKRRRPAANTQEDSGNGMLANVGIGGAIAAGVGYAGYEAHQHLSHGDRQRNVNLSAAYKATLQLAENQSNENRQALYDIALKHHPELQQAFAGYEAVRSSLTKDGGLTTQDKTVLEMVAYNTNLNILDGKIAHISANSIEFSDPGHDRVYYDATPSPAR